MEKLTFRCSKNWLFAIKKIDILLGLQLLHYGAKSSFLIENVLHHNDKKVGVVEVDTSICKMVVEVDCSVGNGGGKWCWQWKNGGGKLGNDENHQVDHQNNHPPNCRAKQLCS